MKIFTKLFLMAFLFQSQALPVYGSVKPAIDTKVTLKLISTVFSVETMLFVLETELSHNEVEFLRKKLVADNVDLKKPLPIQLHGDTLHVIGTDLKVDVTANGLSYNNHSLTYDKSKSISENMRIWQQVLRPESASFWSKIIPEARAAGVIAGAVDKTVKTGGESGVAVVGSANVFGMLQEGGLGLPALAYLVGVSIWAPINYGPDAIAAWNGVYMVCINKNGVELDGWRHNGDKATAIRVKLVPDTSVDIPFDASKSVVITPKLKKPIEAAKLAQFKSIVADMSLQKQCNTDLRDRDSIRHSVKQIMHAQVKADPAAVSGAGEVVK